MALSYPKNAAGVGNDYVIFTPQEYRANARGGGKMAAPSTGGGSIILYMPNSTPPIGNGNNWNDSGATFMGPKGAFFRDAASNLAAGLTAEGGVDGAKAAVAASNARANPMTNLGGGIRQFALEAVTGTVGMDANQILAIEKNEVYNPNIELLYSSPTLRTFQFRYSFIPKNPAEAAMVNSIIRMFKSKAAPQKSGYMFKVPEVFQVTYMSGSGPNLNMNRFKPAALKNVLVQANPQTQMHVAHDGGVPIETSLTLDFQETDIITREDHQMVGGQGF